MIVKGKMGKKLKYKSEEPMKWNIQAGNFMNNYKAKIGFLTGVQFKNNCNMEMSWEKTNRIQV